MNDESIKQAFQRVKGDIFFLGDEIQKLKLMIIDMKNDIKIITQAINDMKEEKLLDKSNEKQEKTAVKEDYAKETIGVLAPTHQQNNPTNRQINPALDEIPTDKLLSQVLKRQISQVSTGNQGVPTDRQTNQQTDQQIIQHTNLPTTKPKIAQITPNLPTTTIIKSSNKNQETNHLDKAMEILNSLDALKKELRLKIKRLTQQEMQVFSLLYSMENQGLLVDYPLLADKLSLSESSIRDYIGKIHKKGIPIVKEKLNNKKIVLHIAPELTKIASLDTLLKLREI